jgi:hypothetical protein
VLYGGHRFGIVMVFWGILLHWLVFFGILCLRAVLRCILWYGVGTVLRFAFIFVLCSTVEFCGFAWWCLEVWDTAFFLAVLLVSECVYCAVLCVFVCIL